LHLADVVLCSFIGLGCSSHPSPATWQAGHYELRLENVAASLPGAEVTADFFHEAGAAPLLGRVFLPEECTPGKGRVAVLAYSLWQSRLAADPTIVGRRVQLNGSEFQVVGVMPQSFASPPGAQVWIPASALGGRGGQ
jgi:hypothetical protein